MTTVSTKPSTKARQDRRWFTCIIVIDRYGTKYFHTRAATALEAEANAKRWVVDGEPDIADEDVDVTFIFEGKLEPEVIEE